MIPRPAGPVAGLPVADRPLVFGVLNVTPDSFSDGGLWAGTDAAVEHGLALQADGADVVDVGGESTRPGAGRVAAEEELRRVVPVVTRLVAAGVMVSIDTMRAEVALAAVAAGASVVNDVSGGAADPAMLGVVADLGVPYVLMHWRAPSDVMAGHARYGADPAGEVRDELAARARAAEAAGIDRARLVLDPGIGFAKDEGHNWAVLAGLDRVGSLGRPLLVGVSRKRFLGSLLMADDATVRPPLQRDVASAVLAALLVDAGVWAVRAHDARLTRDALAVAARMRKERRPAAAVGRPAVDRAPHPSRQPTPGVAP